MNLHEYQAKQLFAEYGIPVPRGRAATSVSEALEVAAELGVPAWVVKAQVHAGGRGKAGGVRLVENLDAVSQAAGELLGTRLVTRQTGARGLPVDRVLIEEPTRVVRELYLGLLVDRVRERVLIIASASGGMEIEEVAAASPDRLVTECVDPAAGLQAWQCRRIAFALGLETQQVRELQHILMQLHRLFMTCDASLVEVNPLVVDDAGRLVALDAKVNLDDNALYRQQALAAFRDLAQEDEREASARKHDLNFISLDGDIGCMVNGAGLAMATMDLVKLQGGEPANFLDVGGGTTAERVAEAFKLILSDLKVRAVLVNIFGGIVRCDLIAEGIIQAVREVGIDVPVVVRLEGTNAPQGLEMLAASGLAIQTAPDLTEAACLAISAAAGGAET